MNSTHKILMGLLLFQLCLGAVTWSTRNQGARGPADARPLVPLAVGDVSAFEVVTKPATEEDEPGRLALAKKGDGWVVASAGDYPAVTSKVEEVLKKLLDLKVKDPIASQKANHNALRVGARDYDRKVSVTGAGKTRHLVVGSAKGSSVHVRSEDSDDVYWVRGLSTWNLSERVTSYVDTQYVNVEDPVRVEVTNPKGSFTITKAEDGGWSVSGLTLPLRPKESEVTSFIDKCKRVTMSDPVGKELKEEYGLSGGARVVLAYKDGEEEKTLTYSIGKEVDGKFYLKADEKEHVVQVSKWSVEKLLEQTPQDFVGEENS